jgi:hypothetical protein
MLMNCVPMRHLLLLCLVLLGVSPGIADDGDILFETDIAPILADKCGACHRDTTQKGGLNLSSMQTLQRGGESELPLVAESLDDSWLWTMVDGGGMPPESEEPLTDDELAQIREWIEVGGPSMEPLAEVEREITQHDVTPIMLLRCSACHGPKVQRGGLDLRSPTAMLEGGDSGPALVPGKPEESLMIQRIESEACPPSELLLKFFVRRPGTTEVETLKTWIAEGAPVKNVVTDVATTEPDPLVSDHDRQHWAFQPPRVASDADAIDGFIQRKLGHHDLELSPPADRDTLIRRAYIDLIGMPPPLDEWRYWREHAESDWFAQMVEDLLASSHYGERWGRYWLDVAGYADSEGGVSADPIRDVAWKYRDYVIDAFNEDKPYDRFLLEQLAGDELQDVDNADEITQQMVENLVATGFLRMGIDQTGSRTMNFVPERLGVISDAITVVSSGVMGLTMECARCHSHKYDPIPHRDYYRFKAIFQGAMDEYDWLSFKTRELDLATPEHRRRSQQVNPPLAERQDALQKELAQNERRLKIDLLKTHAPELSEQDHQDTLVALRKADNQRSLRQRKLVEQLKRAETLPDERQPTGVLKARQYIQVLEREIAHVKERMIPSSKIRALWDRGRPSPTYILVRGEHSKPGRLVGPGVPSVLTDGQTPFEVTPPFPDGTPKTGRRLALARWLTRPDHPLTARVMVNRIWAHHFGTGLVKTLDNFGKQGTPPSHPELLDWLALQFVESGWSIKHMHRLIMNSHTYRQTSHVTMDRRERDPENRWLSRMTLQRMNAEALRDSLLAVSGKLDRRTGGPPDPISVDRDGLVSVNPTSTGGWRRSVYLQYRRTQIPSLMDTFDYPIMGPNCVSRTVSTVSPQALMLKNNEHVYALAKAFAERVQRLLVTQDQRGAGKQVDLVYQLALSRLPSDHERQIGIDALHELEAAWDGDANSALETYCHTMLNSAAFLYVD